MVKDVKIGPSSLALAVITGLSLSISHPKPGEARLANPLVERRIKATPSYTALDALVIHKVSSVYVVIGELTEHHTKKAHGPMSALFRHYILSMKSGDFPLLRLLKDLQLAPSEKDNIMLMRMVAIFPSVLRKLSIELIKNGLYVDEAREIGERANEVERLLLEMYSKRSFFSEIKGSKFMTNQGFLMRRLPEELRAPYKRFEKELDRILELVQAILRKEENGLCSYNGCL